MKPVRCESTEKENGGTILFLPSCFIGSPDHHCLWTPVQQYLLALRLGTHMWSCTCKPESNIAGVLFINKGTSACMKVLHKNFIHAIRIPGWTAIKTHPLMLMTTPTHAYLPHLEGVLWWLFFLIKLLFSTMHKPKLIKNESCGSQHIWGKLGITIWQRASLLKIALSFFN